MLVPDLKAAQVDTLQSSSMGEVPLLDQDIFLDRLCCSACTMPSAM